MLIDFLKNLGFCVILFGNAVIAQNSPDLLVHIKNHAEVRNLEIPYQHISPLPNSTFNPVNSTIIIREGSQIDKSSLSSNVIIVNGTISGLVNGSVNLSSDQKTIIFTPDNPFIAGEIVDVTITGFIVTKDRKKLPGFNYGFSIESFSVQELNNNYQSIENSFDNKSDFSPSISDLPQITTKIYDESKIGAGKLFLSAYGVINQNFQSNPNINSSILIVNNDGSIHFSKDIGSNQGAGLTDFKIHPNGLMSYPKVLRNLQWTGGAEVIHMIIDNSFAIIDSFQMGNGYTAETHDFHILPNGHALLMAYYLIPIDLSNLVPGSHPNAYIDGAVIQELDLEKNVIFQWRTWDYINTNNIPWNLVPGNKQQIINVFHLNSINIDNDGNLLLGTPGMGLKVSRQTGQIMWIIGGIMNQYTFSNVPLNEALGDFGGHTFQRLPNGNILVFDNSPFPWQPGYGQISSEVVEYSINEANKTAQLEWKYKPSDIIPGWHAGSAQRLANGNTLICWGGPPQENNVQIPIVTEVTPSGEKVFELFYEGAQLESYRSYRFEINEGKPSSEVTKSEILALNTYEFKENEKNDTGIEMRINNMNSLGYNMITVKKYDFAPATPDFAGDVPSLIPGRVFISTFGIYNIDATIRFDINKWNISDPSNTVIYYRPTDNRGQFFPLGTTYNFVTGKIAANISGFGEFVLGKENIPHKALVPIPNSPADLSTVNYSYPVYLTWSPRGFARTYSLQVSREKDFSVLEVDESFIKEAHYGLLNLLPNSEYFWRIRTHNDAGDSPWSSIQSFTAIYPFIKLKKPNGGEKWNIGLEYFVEWEDNIQEEITISLLRDDKPIKKISTTANSFFLWEIDLNLALADDYKIKLTSIKDSTLSDISDNFFSINNSISSVEGANEVPGEFYLFQNYPNPFNSGTTFSFTLADKSFTTLSVYNILGQEIQKVVNSELGSGRYSYYWEAGNMPSGLYFFRLVSGSYFDSKKLLIIK